MRLLAPLRLCEFRLLWTGMSLSLLGDGVLLVAFAWQAYALSNRPAGCRWWASPSRCHGWRCSLSLAC